MMNSPTPVIVSMTSYPGRIGNVSKSIFSLLREQTRRPDEIHLWLSKEQFPNLADDLPEDLQLLATAGMFELHWLDGNTYVHKRHEIFKLVNRGYVFLMDDDVRYNEHLIQTVIKTAALYPDTIICYNKYSDHIYSGKRIKYNTSKLCPGPVVNQVRWCGQSMIPAHIYPVEILTPEMQAIRNRCSPISDECWFQPWVVLHDIPIYYHSFGWGTDFNAETGKNTGLTSWTHSKESNGMTKRDNWLSNTISAFPRLADKYHKLFNYG